MRALARVAAILVAFVGGFAIVALIANQPEECGPYNYSPCDYPESALWAAVMGPAIVGGLVAMAAGGRANWLLLGVALYVVPGIVLLVWSGEDAAGEALVVLFWVVATGITGLYITAGAIWLYRRLRSGTRGTAATDLPENVDMGG